MSLQCSDCHGPISTQSKTGRCRRCAVNHSNADPAIRARKAEANRRKSQDPAFVQRAVRHLQAGQKAARSDPERAAKLVAKVQANLALAWSVEARRKWYAGRKEAARRRTETMLGWCPPRWRDEYRRLRNCWGRGAAEARRMIEEKMAIERANMTPFERQMEALRNGARLIEKPRFRSREYDFTLGGVSDL